MRVTLLPRDAAGRVITGAVSAISWAAGATIIVVTMPPLVETLIRMGRPDVIPVALGLLMLMLVAIGVAIWRMTPGVVAGYLLVGGIIATAYEVVLVDAGVMEAAASVFLLNRPLLALVTIGVAARTALGGILWCVSGYIVSWIATLSASAITGVPVGAGWGPTITVCMAVVLYLTLFAIQERQRRRLPRFDELEAATKRRAASADLARRTTAMVHDTVLNDLAFVMNAPDELDDRARARLLEDLDTLESGEWMRATAMMATSAEEQTRVRNDFTRLASDFRWRGLTVNVTGAGRDVLEYPPGTGDALLAAIRASLENVLRHAKTDSADIEVVYTPEQLTFMVSDQGAGFDMSEVDANRLGIRDSILGRIEAVGGQARIWSSPGAGTTVLISVPVRTVEAGRPSDHRERHHER